MNGSSAPLIESNLLKSSRPIPLLASEASASIRICILVRSSSDPVEGWFYLLRDLPEARVYLGALVDAGGRTKEWLEIWVQNVDGFACSLATYRSYYNNGLLDQRWTKLCEAIKTSMPPGFLETGWEHRHPLPIFIDLSNDRACCLQQGDPPENYELCRDDGLLQSLGLPGYSTSLYRYLYQPSLGKSSRFIPAVADAPENSVTQPLSELLAARPSLTALNPQGGLMMILSFHSLSLDEFVDLLSEKPDQAGLLKYFHFAMTHPAGDEIMRSRNLGPYFFLGAHGKSGRLIESFHLRLHLLARAVALARNIVQTTQLPFFNLSHESFRIKLGEFQHGLPWLWNSQCSLVKPGQACPLPIRTTDQRFFVFVGNPQPSAYQPEGLANLFQGFGTVRLRKILPPEDAGVMMEGTLVMPEPQVISPRDLLWLRIPLLTSRVDLYGHAYAAEGLARGEIRFRTLPQKLPEAVLVALRAAEGVPFSRCSFEIVPILSTACDLYSLGVLAIRVLLVHEKTTLAVKMDEVLSLARQLDLEFNPDIPLPQRLQTIFEKESKWLDLLGPQHLSHGEMTAQTAFQWIPPELWFAALAALIRHFPGTEGICRDWGDAPPLALDSIFTPALQAWQQLILRSRSLILGDWNFNREIHSVIEQYRS